MNTPLYKQIEQEILRRIDSGEYSLKQRLPSEYELAEDFNASRLTVRKAVAHLVNENRLYRKENAGLYVVAPSKITSGEGGLSSFSEVAKRKGKKAKTVVQEYKVLEYDEKIWKELDAQPSESIHFVERVRSFDDDPMTIERLWIRGRYLPKDTQAEWFENSLFELIERTIPIAYSHQEIEAKIAGEREANLLNIKENDAVLFISSHTYGARGIPILIDHSFYRGDKYKFSSTYSRRG